MHGSSPPTSSVHEFPRQEHWSVLPFPSLEYLPDDPGIKPASPALTGEFFTHFLEFYISRTLQDALYFCLIFCVLYGYFVIYPCCVHQPFVSFHSRVLLCCMDLPLFAYPLIFRRLAILVVSSLGLLQIKLLWIFVSQIEYLTVKKKSLAASPVWYLTSLNRHVSSYQNGKAGILTFGRPEVKTPPPSAEDAGSVPAQGAETAPASQPKAKTRAVS